MELTSLRYFIEVAKCGNISRAAERLHLTQPSLSRQIRLLEEELGKPLFIRGFHKVILTETGSKLYEKAREIVSLSDSTLQDLVSDKKELEGVLRIAVTPGVMQTRISSAFAGFLNSNKKVGLYFISGGLQACRSLLNSHKVDAALMFSSKFTEDLNILDLNMDRALGFTMRIDDPMSKYSSLSVARYSGLPIIAPIEGLDLSLFKDLDIDYSNLNICSWFDDPRDYYDIINLNGGYLFDLEPDPRETMNRNICFRPIEPVLKAHTIFARPLNEENGLVDALFSFFKTNLILN